MENKGSKKADMIIMNSGAKPEEISHVIEEIRKVGLKADVSQGSFERSSASSGMSGR